MIIFADNRDTEIQTSLDGCQGEETPLARVRFLRENYENCSFVLNISDPLTFEEAEKISK